MQIACPECSATYEVEENLAGDNVQCVCGCEFVAVASPPPKPATPKSQTATNSKAAPVSFGKAPPASVFRTLLDLGWDASDFRRYEKAGYGLLCWYVRWIQKLQRIAAALILIATAKVVYETISAISKVSITLDLLWSITKGLGSFLAIVWGSWFASLLFAGAFFQFLKAGISVEMNTRDQ